MDNNIHTLLPISGRGYTVYNRHPVGSNQFGKPHVISQLILLGRKWFEIAPNVPFSIGDISNFGGGHMRGHIGHLSGLEVDIRPLRRDRLNKPVHILNAMYDQDFTIILIRHIWRYCKIDHILFNDSKSVMVV